MGILTLDQADLAMIAGALVIIAEKGADDLNLNQTETNAQALADVYGLAARILQAIDHPDAAAMRHNAEECTRMVAHFQLARITGRTVELDIDHMPIPERRP